jgi:general stress protein 26
VDWSRLNGTYNGESMIEKMKTLLRRNSMAVLATCTENKPYCSLMTYVTDEQALTLYTATLKTSRKYKNILENPHVSLLVDSRMDDLGDAESIKALTIGGICFTVKDKAVKGSILTRILEHNPHLHPLLSHPDVEVIAVQVESFLLLDGPMESSFVEIRKPTF